MREHQTRRVFGLPGDPHRLLAEGDGLPEAPELDETAHLVRAREDSGQRALPEPFQGERPL